MTTTTRGPSRRTLVKGAAWSVPVVAVAGAAPAHAASQETWFEDLGLACKSPGNSCGNQNAPEPRINKGYFIRVNVCTNVRADVSIDFGATSVSLGGQPPTNDWSIQPDPLVIPYGNEDGTRCRSVVLGIQGEPNSQNVSIAGTGQFTWTATNGLSGSGVISFSAPSTPPCPNCGEVPSVQEPAPTTQSVEDTTVTADTATTTTDEASSTASP